MVRTKVLAKDDYPHNKLVREQAKIDAEKAKAPASSKAYQIGPSEAFPWFAELTDPQKAVLKTQN